MSIFYKHCSFNLDFRILAFSLHDGNKTTMTGPHTACLILWSFYTAFCTWRNW